MTALPVFYLSAKHLLRLYIPNTTVRYALVFAVSFFILGGVGLGIVFGVHPPPQWKGGFRSQEFMNNLSGLFFILNNSIVMIPTFLTIRGSLKLLNNPESVSLILISPVSPVTKFWSSLGPLIFFSSLPYLAMVSPFIVMFLFLDPLISFATILYFVIISGWSVVLCFASLVALTYYFGKDKAMRLSYAIPFILLFVPALFTVSAENFRRVAPLVGYWQLIFFSVSIVLLPPLFKYTCRLFYALITNKIDSPKEFGEPLWGEYNPWRYIQRQAVSLSLIPIFLFIVLMLAGVIHFEGINQTVFAITVFVFVTAPIGVIMQDERNHPDRWLLAPYAIKIKKAIWLKMNLPLLLVGAVGIIVMGIGHIVWIGSILFILLLSMIVLTSHALYKNSGYQNILYFVLIIGCFIAQLSW
jgi:hypothetical protein